MRNKKEGKKKLRKLVWLVLTLSIFAAAPQLWADQPPAPAPLATVGQTDAAQTAKYQGPALTGEDISPLSNASQ